MIVGKKGDMTHSGCVKFCNKYIDHAEYGTEILDIWAEILFHGKGINIT